MNTKAIADHLNIVDSAIIEIQEWSKILWVKFIGGCRFVSKKINEVKMTKNMAVDYKVEKFSDLETIVRHFNTGGWVRVNNSTGAISAEFCNRPNVITDEHREYAIAQAKLAATSTPVQPKKFVAVKINSATFNKGVAACKAAGGKYDPSSKTWEIVEGSVSSSLVTIVGSGCGYWANSSRKSCINCGITNMILSNRGYCTDCDGEC